MRGRWRSLGDCWFNGLGAEPPVLRAVPIDLVYARQKGDGYNGICTHKTSYLQ